MAGSEPKARYLKILGRKKMLEKYSRIWNSMLRKAKKNNSLGMRFAFFLFFTIFINQLVPYFGDNLHKAVTNKSLF